MLKKLLLLVFCLVLMGCQTGASSRIFVDDFGETELSAEEVNEKLQSLPGIDRGNYLTLGAYQIDERMNPLITDSISNMDARRFLFNGLINLYNGEIVDDLASYKVSEDGKTYRFTLHEANFHNGDLVTADDVIFTYKVLAHKDYKGPYITVLSDMVGLKDYQAGNEAALGLKKIDDKTVEMYFNEGGLEKLVQFTVPIISHKHYAYDHFIEFEQNMHDPIGTGPFVFSEIVEHQYIKLERFEDYFGDNAYIDGIIIHIMPFDTADLIISGGEVDFSFLPNTIDTVDILQGQEVIEYKELPNNHYDFIALNFANNIFNDQKVRQAFAYAVDLDQFNETRTAGYSDRIYTSVSPESQAYPNELNTYDQDIDKAAQLLNEAGWIDTDGDGLLDKDGIAFDVEWLYLEAPLNYTHKTAIREAIDDLASIGIKVEMKSYYHSALVRKLYYDHDYDICSFSTGFDWFDNPRARFGITSSSNATLYHNEEAEDLFSRMDQTSDPEERLSLMREWGVLANETLPLIFLSRSSIFVVNNPRVYNYSSNENILKEVTSIKLKYLK